MNTVKILQGRASSDAAPPRAFDGSRGKGFREMRARVIGECVRRAGLR
jgi:hypothetical protein